MNSKIEFVLKPVTGAASAKGGYHAILTTAKGDAMDSTPFGRGAKTIWTWHKGDFAMARKKIAHGCQKAQNA